MKKKLFIGVLLLTQYGCSIMSVEECKTANWESVGEKDGALGKQTQLAKYDKACQKAEISPVQTSYEKGYRKGLQYYCQPQKIFTLALKGQGRYDVCPLEQQQGLTNYYNVAHRYYSAKIDYENTKAQYNRQLNLLMSSKVPRKDIANYQRQLNNLDSLSIQRLADFWTAERNMLEFKKQYRLN